jgi:hypothetical protein
MPSTDSKLELKAKTSVAQTDSQPYVYAKELIAFSVRQELKRMRWAGNIACMGERRGVYRVLVGKPVGKRPLGRPRHRWEDNIRMDL